MKLRKWFCVLACSMAICTLASAHERGAHVHGTATLQITLEENTLTLTLDTPLNNLVGFEHVPRTQQQKNTVHYIIEKLRQPEMLFGLTPAAQCLPSGVTLTAPLLGLGTSEKMHPEKNDGHAGLTAEINFTCTSPAAMKEIDVKLFREFNRLHLLNAQIVRARGQSASRLTPKNPRILW